MGNTEIVDTVVDPAVRQQFKDLQTDSAAATESMAVLLKTATDLNTALANSKGLIDYQKQVDATAKAVNAASANNEKARLSEIRLQQAREKAFDDYEKKLQKQQAAEQKAADAAQKRAAKMQTDADKTATKVQADEAKKQAAFQKTADADEKAMQKQLASEARIMRQREKDSAKYRELVKNRDFAQERARNIGAQFGSDSEIFQAATKEANAFQKQIVDINEKLGNYKENVGNYASAAYGLIRKIAYALPGIGIAGIFGLLLSPFQKLIEELYKGESVITTMNNLQRKANDIYADQIVTVKGLVAEVQDQNTTGARRQEIIEQLNEISPTYFNNLKSEQDIVSKLPEDYKKYNAALFQNALAKAALEIIAEKQKEILSLQRDIVEGQDVKNPDRAGGFAALQELSLAIDELGAPGKQKHIKELQAQIDRLYKQFVTGNQKAGDITGSAEDIQERITNNAIEYNKGLIQIDQDKNDAIASDDRKSYEARRAALKQSLFDQSQIINLNATQQLNNQHLTQDEIKLIQDKANFDVLKAQQDYAKKRQDLNSAETKQEVEHAKNQLELQKAAAKQTIDSPGASFDNRYAALETYNQKAKKLLSVEYKEELRLAGQNQQSILIAQDHYNKAKIDLQTDYVSQYSKLLEDEYNAQMQGAKKHDTDLLNLIKTSTAQDNQAIAEQAKKSIDILDDKYEKSGGSFELYQAKREAIQKEASDNILQNNIDEQNKIIALLKASGLDATTYEQQLARLEEQQFKEKEENKTRYIRTESQLRKDLLNAEFDFAKESVKSVQQIIDSSYEADIAKLQDQQKQITETATSQKAAIDGSIQSAADKQRKDAIVDAEAAQSQQKLQQKQKDLKKKEADINKKASALSVAVSGAEALAKVELEGAILLANPLTAPLAPLAFAQIPFIIGTVAAQEAAIFAQKTYKHGTKSVTDPRMSIWGEAGIELAREPSGKTYLSPDAPTFAKFPIGTEIVPHYELTKLISPDKLRTVEPYDPRLDLLISETRKNRPQRAARPRASGWMSEAAKANTWASYTRNYFK